jgi:hypothetical protein
MVELDESGSQSSCFNYLGGFWRGKSQCLGLTPLHAGRFPFTKVADNWGSFIRVNVKGSVRAGLFTETASSAFFLIDRNDPQIRRLGQSAFRAGFNAFGSAA